MTPTPGYLIYNFLVARGVSEGNIHMADAAYVCPSSNWICTTFKKAWLQMLTNLGLSKWTAEEYDCDDFAQFCDSYASILHRKTTGRPLKTGLAFGDFWYASNQLGGLHAINFAVVADGANKPKLLFFEPQNGEELQLTTEEINSCVKASL